MVKIKQVRRDWKTTGEQVMVWAPMSYGGG